jgi:hypothetical protein
MSVTRYKIRLVLKGIKVIRIYIAKLVELAKKLYTPCSYNFFFLFVSFILPLRLRLYLVLKTSTSGERYSRDIGRRV